MVTLPCSSSLVMFVHDHKCVQTTQDEMKRLEDQVKKQVSDMKLLQQQYTEVRMPCDIKSEVLVDLSSCVVFD